MHLNGLLIICLTMSASLATQEGADQSTNVIHGKSGITLPPPPPVKSSPVTDEYRSDNSGAPVKVTDNYRWLENATAPDTRAFVKAENAYTQRYLDQVKILPQVRNQMAALQRVHFVGIPERRGNRYFFAKRLAAEHQASIYMRTGLHGPDERLIDANALSADHNTSLSMVALAEDGSLLVRRSRRRRGRTRDPLPEPGNPASNCGRVTRSPLLWRANQPRPEGSLLFEVLPPGRHSRLLSCVWNAPHGGHHRSRRRVSRRKARRNRQHWRRSHRQWALPHLQRWSWCAAKREDILVKDLRVADSPISPLVYGIESRFTAFNIGDTFYVDTDCRAPNHRILKAEFGQSPDQWQVIVPEDKDVIEEVNLVAGNLYILRLKDVKSELTIYSVGGKQIGKIAFPGLGAGSTLFGRSESKDGFYSFESITTPPTMYQYDTATGHSQVFAQRKVPFNSTAYDLKEVFYSSKDGTRVPMFIAGRKGLKCDGTERLLMTGYGGFALSERPVWNSESAWWMQQGGWFALPCLRGGNEYGEAWHKAAMFQNKQNVFYDWFAAAEYLIREKYTAPEHFAIHGRSNGGLLMGASMTQRPDLFGAIWSAIRCLICCVTIFS